MDNSTNCNTSSTDSCASNLIKLLDSEIVQIMAEQTRPGWNNWALCAAFGALLWLLFNQINTPNIVATRVVYLFVLIVVTNDAFAAIKSLLNNNPESPSSIISTDNANKLTLVSLLLSNIFICYGIYRLNYYNYSIMLIVYYSFMVLVYFVFTVFAFLKLPIPVAAGGNKKWFGIIILILMLVYPAFVNLTNYILNGRYYLLNDLVNIKIVSILFALYFIFKIIINLPQSSGSLSTLNEIRRSLILGKITYESALRQADIALNGMKVSDVFKDDINVILTKYQQYEKIVDDNIDKINAAYNELSAEDEEMSESKKKICIAVIDSALDSVSKNFNKLNIEKHVDKINNKIKYLTLMSKGDKEITGDISNLLDKVKGLIKQCKIKHDDFINAMRPLCLKACHNVCDSVKPRNNE